MKVQVRVVGEHQGLEIKWPADWPIPREDEAVETDDATLYVRHVDWYPTGSEDDDQPFIYLVLGPRSPRD